MLLVAIAVKLTFYLKTTVIVNQSLLIIKKLFILKYEYA
jgi:hypothetical protein